MFTLPNGTNIGFGQTFTIEGEKFSPTWLSRATPEMLASKGITRVEAPVVVYKDDRFYFNNGNDGATPKSVEQVLPPIVTGIKARAGSLIEERYPDYKQRNMLAASVVLQDTWRKNGVWTVEEQSQASTLTAAWDWIKSVRNHSNALEAEVGALDFAGLEAWSQHDWPVNPDAPVGP